MSIPSRLIDYLDQRGMRYEVLPHEHSRCSAQTARSAHIPPQRLAKSVMVGDAEQGWLMAVLPADRKVQLGDLARLLGRSRLQLAEELQFAPMLCDCARGALPAPGMAWGIETVVDEALEEDETGTQVYFEAGDHQNLICMSRAQFARLMQDSRHGRFSEPAAQH